MHINVHAHVFTLAAVLSREAVAVITRRLEEHGVPDFFVEAIARLLDDLLDRPRYLDERELLAMLFEKLTGIRSFSEFLSRGVSTPSLELVLSGAPVDDLPVDALQAALDHLAALTLADDPAGTSVTDVVQTLRMAMRGTITEVADGVLSQMDADDALVALMMDIHAPGEPARDLRNMLLQIRGTEEAALQRPGRVLPFFAVHPERADHFELMRDAIERRGFLGVKLYPSLGYQIDHPALMRVYAYCADADVPVLLHCGHGGFYRQEDYIDFCDPSHWEDVLRNELEDIRVCFAHFGGWETLGRPDGLDAGTWGHTILRLMRERSGVFTDLAYHTNQMKDPDDERRYFATLATLLEDDHLQRRIMFGTDSWLLRLDMTDATYWHRFREGLGEIDFHKIAGLAPRAFLGFPEMPGGPMRANLRRYVEHMAAHREDVGAEPATWLAELVDGEFAATRYRADWDWSRHAVKCTHQYFHHRMSNVQRHKGFRLHRTLRLGQLEYFRPRDPNFELICGREAADFVAFSLRMPGATGFRTGHDANGAVLLFTDMLRRGEKTLAGVAASLDATIEFAEPIA